MDRAYPVKLHQTERTYSNLMEMLDSRPDTRPTRGTLTTEHAASSHGLPVVVVDGVALGPAECPPITVYRPEDDYATDGLERLDGVVALAASAGYQVVR